jgi:hypothetical protein
MKIVIIYIYIYIHFSLKHTIYDFLPLSSMEISNYISLINTLRLEYIREKNIGRFTSNYNIYCIMFFNYQHNFTTHLISMSTNTYVLICVLINTFFFFGTIINTFYNSDCIKISLISIFHK